MTSPFDRFGIKHLSPSSLAKFRNEPAYWVMQYVHGFKDESGPAAMRGTSVEAGVDAGLYGAADEEAIAAALAKFAELTAGVIDPDTEAERAVIPGMVKQALSILRPFGKPMARQIRIETWIDGIEIPVIGFVDYAFATHDLDLKSTLRTPSAARPDHVAQVATYWKARGKEQSLLYVTARKAQRFDIDREDLEGAIWTVKRSALALRRALEVSADKGALSDLFVPRLDSFYWNEQSRAAALQIWR